MEKIKTIDTKRASYFSVFAVNARLSLGLLFEFSKSYVFYIQIGLGVVELSYSIQKIAHKPRNGQVV